MKGLGTIRAWCLSPLSSRSVEVSVSGLVTTMPERESPQFSSCCTAALGMQNRPASAAANAIPGAAMPSVPTTPCCHNNHKRD